MATTANGMPYPVGTDKVVDGDNAIRALAEKVDTSLLPYGFARIKDTTGVGHGAAAWNTMHLDSLVAAHGSQPWTLEAANRRVKLLKDGTYLLQASLTMNGPLALAIAISTDGATWDRIASVPIGTVNYSNSVTALRWIPANTYVVMQAYAATALTVIPDQTGSPSYLAIQALGGQ